MSWGTLAKTFEGNFSIISSLGGSLVNLILSIVIKKFDFSQFVVSAGGSVLFTGSLFAF